MRPKKQTPTQSRPAPDVTLPASIVGVFGASGSGKSSYVKQCLAAAMSPLIVFDPGHEYAATAGAVLACDDEPRFHDRVNATENLRLAFRPSHDAALRARQFGRFCLVGLAIARARGRCLVVADELHLMTDAGNAPAGWNELVMTGRKCGVSIIAASIRPAAINKDFWTNCTLVRTGRLLFADDQKTVARALGVNPEELAQLKSPPGAPGCDFIERDMLTGETRRGRLTF